MSRSYKKTPGWKDHNKDVKAIANRKARRFWHWEKTPSGGGYKRLTEQWNICDWNCRYYSESEVDRKIEENKKIYKNRGWENHRITPKYKYFMK